MNNLEGGWQNINVQLPAESDIDSGNAAVINSTIYILQWRDSQILTFDTISQTYSPLAHFA